MKKKNKKIYVTSNVSIDYFFFLCKILKNLGYEVIPLYLITEAAYRLSSKGLNFKTKSDTEVILKAYQTWGVNFIIKLRGMFSIVIFDDLKHDVYLFRDHLGQKPLYYSYINNLLVLSSEIKDILFLARKNKFNLNDNNISINKYLIRGWCDDNNQTFYENIFSFSIVLKFEAYIEIFI